MNTAAISLCMIIATLMSIFVVYKCTSEQYRAIPEVQLKQQVDTCHRWSGRPVQIDNKMYCHMPNVVKNTNVLNFQLAGKLCDLEYLHETLGCRSIEGATNPYNVNASRGTYSWYR